MADEKSGPGAEEWVIQTIRDHGLSTLAFVLVVIVAAIAGAFWYLGRRFALKGAELDNRKKEGELLDRLNIARKHFLQSRETFDLCLLNVRDAIAAHKNGAKTVVELRACRDEMCRLYTNEYMTALTEYLEQLAVLQGKSDAVDRIKNEIVPALRTMNRFLELVNKPMLDLLPGAKFQLRMESRDGLYSLIQKSVPILSQELKNELEQLKLRTDAHIRSE